MADGPIVKNFLKRPYIASGLTDRHKIWHGDAYWSAVPYQQLKIWILKNPRWRTVVILITVKLLYLWICLADRYDSALVNKLYADRYRR